MTRPDFKLAGRLCQKHRRALDDRLPLFPTPSPGGLVTHAASAAHAGFVASRVTLTEARVIIDGTVSTCEAPLTRRHTSAPNRDWGRIMALHRGIRDAKMFYATFALMVCAAAGIVLLPGAPLGLITTSVQALAGELFTPASLSVAGVGPVESEFLAAIEPLGAPAGAPR